MEQIISEQIFKPKSLFPGRELAFEQDFDLLFNKSPIKDSQNILTLNTFKYLWKECFLRYLCSTRDKKESAEEFYQMIYGLLICKYFSPENLNTNLACIYSLYIIFLSQPEYERVQININLNFLRKLNQLLKNSYIKEYFHFKWIIQKLVSLNAFSYEYRVGIKELDISKYGTPQNNPPEIIINELVKQKFNEEDDQNRKFEEQLEEMKKTCESYLLTKKKIIDNIQISDSKEKIDQELNKTDILLPNFIEFKLQNLNLNNSFKKI